MKIVIGDNEYLKCVEFAEKCCGTNKDEYNRRNQFDISKIKKDIIIGKIAELAIYHFLTKKKQVECNYPDFNIYSKNNKSYDSDLKTDRYDIHVKSQNIESANRFGMSWQFQKRDSITHSPTVKDVICLCIIDDRKVEIKKMILAGKLVGKYGVPKLEKLRETKLTLYYEDIKNL